MAQQIVAGEKIQTDPAVARSHAEKIKKLHFDEANPNLEIHFTNLTDIVKGATDTKQAAVHARLFRTNFQNYATHLSDLVNKIEADDRADARNWN